MNESRRPRKMRGKVRNLLWACFFFILGVIGLLIPVLPQIPFFLASLLFFSLVFPGLRRALRRFLRRHPRADHAYRKWRDSARRKRQKVIARKRELVVSLSAIGARGRDGGRKTGS